LVLLLRYTDKLAFGVSGQREEAKLTEFHGIPSFLELDKHLHINPLNSVPAK
jgi:hypothetical protein